MQERQNFKPLPIVFFALFALVFDSRPLLSQGCKVDPKASKDVVLTFEDISGSRKCNQADGNGEPAFIVVFRDCDKSFLSSNSCTPTANCPAGSTLDPTCDTNACSSTGINRSWILAKWLKCFSDQQQATIAGVISQTFVAGETNRRPATTASILYQSLLYSKDPIAPCYDYVRTDDLPWTAKTIRNSAFNNKVVAIVTSRETIPNVVKQLTGQSIAWNKECFDGAVVIDKNQKVYVYVLQTLSNADPCGKMCSGAVFKGCTFATFDTAGVCAKW